MLCIQNNASFPSYFHTENIESGLLQRRVQCGDKPGYYPARSTCVNYYDETVKPAIVGGCSYDMGLGRCLSDAVSDASAGCASKVEDFMVARVEGHLYAVIGATFLSAVTSTVRAPYITSLHLLHLARWLRQCMVVVSCCVWWKRKVHDVYPADAPALKHTVTYEEVPLPFAVAANQRVLADKGFLLGVP